jgi:molybdenum-dependent DNA-binding transcriptional regulator ModE
MNRDKHWKEKLDEWELIKNLPKQTAIWVLEKEKRRRDKGKATVYKFGGKQLKLFDVEKKAKRIKLQQSEAPVIGTRILRTLPR